MTDVYYIRKRGKVTGPFELDQLVQLRDQGKLNRVHELSTDGNIWQSAFQVQEVFPAASTVSLADSEVSDSESPLQSSGITREPPLVSDWYYAVSGEKLGPVSYDALVALIADGQINEHTEVWNQTLQEWMPAGEVPQLDTCFPSKSVGAVSKDSSTSINVMAYCRGCGGVIHGSAPSCPHCGAVQPITPRKSKVVAGLLALFLGGLGVHRYYLGQWWGIFYPLGILLFSFGFPVLLAPYGFFAFIPISVSFAIGAIPFIEAIVFFCTSDTTWNRKYG